MARRAEPLSQPRLLTAECGWDHTSPESKTVMQLFWFFPTSGEGRYLATNIGARPVTMNYLRQIACAIDELGYTGALLPTGQGCEDAWVTAAALMPFTRCLKFLAAVRPGLSSPGLAARIRVAELLFPALGLHPWGHSID